MTSMELFPPTGDVSKSEPKEWGTGDWKADAKDKVWIAKKPTWQYSGEANEHQYTLTPLKLSHVRMTDQLLPDPKHCIMGPLLINKPFPAEHPYSSHISRTSLIPKFDSPEDPKRGVNARTKPINDEMPACPYDVTIVSKTKGSGLRHEIQELPSESDRQPLVWLGEYGFDQLVKTHGGRQSYYPMPPKLICPNLQDRAVDMKISERSANTLRNVERSHWQTSYDLTHTGLGDANTLALDNYDEKMNKFMTDGTEDDNLYPRSVNTFVPPRPVEGRIARSLNSPPQPQTTQCEQEQPCTRKMTLNEIEEDRLLHGKAYANLPTEREMKNQPNVNNGLNTSVSLMPSKVATTPAVQSSQTYLDTFKEAQNEKFQQIEAQNRWKVLESHTPKHDIELLNVKYSHIDEGHKPKVFYDHEGKFNEERAGLYKTSYDPYKLYHSMDHLQTSGPEIMNTMFSHVDAINVPTELNPQMTEALADSVTCLNKKVFDDELSPVTSFEKQKHFQKEWLQPSIKNSRVKVQEGKTILKESTKGDSFNVPKFLQEYELPKYARNDPERLMSSENQSMDYVRLTASLKTGTKSVRFSDDLRQSLPVRSSNRTGQPNTMQYTSRQAMWKRENEDHDSKDIVPVFGISDTIRREKTMPCTSAVVRFSNPRPISSHGRVRNDFASLSSNFAPANLTTSRTEDTAYSKQFPAYDMRKEEDWRFSWTPGCGTPRPQTTLLKLQESFCKSQVHKKFHTVFNESAPDLRHGIRQGKKHLFDGMNAQTLHG